MAVVDAKVNITLSTADRTSVSLCKYHRFVLISCEVVLRKSASSSNFNRSLPKTFTMLFDVFSRPVFLALLTP